MPAVWDYASSGLETGLGLVWLAGSYAALVHSMVPRPMARHAMIAVLLGLGPLIRPEFALYSGGFLVVLLFAVGATEGRLRVHRVVVIAFGAAAIPVGFEIVRMGYYGAIVPNTAIAKEAFAGNWNQGRCYFDNFFGTYALGWPLVASAAFLLLNLWSDAVGRRRLAFMMTIVPVVAALLHVLFIVAIGGDYMHARLFIPALFAGLLPVATVPLTTLRSGLRRWIAMAAMTTGGCLGAYLHIQAAILTEPGTPIT